MKAIQPTQTAQRLLMASCVQNEALPEWGCRADINAYDAAVGIVIKKAKK